ncbi:HET-domain-containing protein, partial [Mytilinidion resinicola]
MPDRLVDVGPATGSTAPKLLDDTSQVKGPYLALSHCWGGTMPYRTLKSNKDELCQRMEFSRLARNIQDAVTITRGLNYRYIWIDSYCIVQDDPKDWLEQASKMASIYAGAFLTICATRSASFNEGFLSDRKSDIELPLADRLPSGMAIYARDCNKLEDGHNNITGAIPTEGSPLFRRAWCYQERLLSQRALHFMDTELVLECEEDLMCECNEQDSYESEPEKQFYCKDADGVVGVPWQTLVELYTFRQLTYPLDILPAISAVASDYGIKDYIAGLDGQDLMSNLLWRT